VQQKIFCSMFLGCRIFSSAKLLLATRPCRLARVVGEKHSVRDPGALSSSLSLLHLGLVSTEQERRISSLRKLKYQRHTLRSCLLAAPPMPKASVLSAGHTKHI
jgi:hypothetical protein